MGKAANQALAIGKAAGAKKPMASAKVKIKFNDGSKLKIKGKDQTKQRTAKRAGAGTNVRTMPAMNKPLTNPFGNAQAMPQSLFKGPKNNAKAVNKLGRAMRGYRR